MRNIRKNITISLYLISILGIGLASIFTGRTVADRQKKIIPSESEARGTVCAIKCRCEVGGVEYDNGEYYQQMCQSSCKLRDEKECSGKLEWPCNREDKCNDCWAPSCEPPATPTPTPTIIPTPTPPPGCWDTCTPGTCPQTPKPLDCQDVDGLRCVNPICPSESNCECPVLACLDLAATSTALVDGDEVDLTCKGSSGVDQPVNHVEFRAQIEGGTWQSLGTAPATKTGDEYEGTISYTVPQTGSYQIECRVCTSADDSQCTLWGKAE